MQLLIGNLKILCFLLHSRIVNAYYITECIVMRHTNCGESTIKYAVWITVLAHGIAMKMCDFLNFMYFKHGLQYALPNSHPKSIGTAVITMSLAISRTAVFSITLTNAIKLCHKQKILP